MSDTQTVWLILWKRALEGNNPEEPFEISDLVPKVVGALKVSAQEAAQLISGLMKELERLPEGRQYFRLEGNAIVPLPEFARVPRDPESELAAYPYEL